MILTIIFFFILLFGISLFVAVVGTAFLRRNARRVHRPPGYPIREGGVSNRYRREFRDSTYGGAEMGVRGAPAYVPEGTEAVGFRKAKTAGTEGKWFLITILVLIVVIFSFYFGIKGYQNLVISPRLFFCENVDYVRQKPINKSITFTRGNVTVFLRSAKPLEQNKARVDIYKIDARGLSPYASKELPLKPEWTSFSFKTLFDSVGSYTVMVYNGGGRLIDQENIFIVPDAYAYKPSKK